MTKNVIEFYKLLDAIETSKIKKDITTTCGIILTTFHYEGIYAIEEWKVQHTEYSLSPALPYDIELKYVYNKLNKAYDIYKKQQSIIIRESNLKKLLKKWSKSYD